jgi:hypothetical protein
LKPPKAGNVVPFALTASVATGTIRVRAGRRGGVELTEAAFKAMVQGGPNHRQVGRLLLEGRVDEAPQPVFEIRGAWRCIFHGRVPDDHREARLTVISWGKRLIVEAVSWQ